MTSLSENTVVTTSGGLVELGFNSRTTGISVDGTSWGSATIINPNTAVVCDGSPVVVQFSCGQVEISSASQVQFALFRDGSAIAYNLAWYTNNGSSNEYQPVSFSFRDTPTAGLHTYSVRAIKPPGTFVYLYASSGSSQSDGGPATMRVSKIVQASQFIVPLASAPLVTSLPSAPIDGQEIRYVADATNGIIWNLRYRAASSSSYKWEFVGGSSLRSTGAGGTTNSATPQTANTPSITVPLAGDYDCTYGGFTQNTIYNVVHNASIGLYKDSTGLETLNFVPVGTYNGGNIAGLYRATGINASQIFNLRYWVSGSTAVFGSMYIHISPIRVG